VLSYQWRALSAHGLPIQSEPGLADTKFFLSSSTQVRNTNRTRNKSTGSLLRSIIQKVVNIGFSQFECFILLLLHAYIGWRKEG
jgi:hypothetical protein